MSQSFREETWGVPSDGGSPHPLFLLDGRGEPSFVRVDHDVLRPIVFGLPTVGWQGDARFAVYSDGRNKFVLFRLERDGEYRRVRDIPTDRPLSPRAVGELCRWLVERDPKRGFDVLAHIEANNARVDREREQREADERAQVADKLAWALKRDLGGHLGGSRFDHKVGRVPWHEEKASTEGED